MKIDWIIEPEDIQEVHEFVNTHINNPLVKERIKRNAENQRGSITKESFFKAMISCLLTSQQRSGPNGVVSKFICTKPFPLNYDRCVVQNNIERFAQEEIVGFGGIRFTNKIPHYIYNNLKKLENGFWNNIFQSVQELHDCHNQQKERQISDYFADQLVGFGPKQSRNLLQSLGLTRFEIPVDSRIIKWLNNFGFPVELSSKALSDVNYYHFILDGIQRLCAESEILPCIFDAAIFASVDGEGWTEQNVIW